MSSSVFYGARRLQRLQTLPSHQTENKSQVATDRRRWCRRRCRPCLRAAPSLQTTFATRRCLARCCPKRRPEISQAVRHCSRSRAEHAQKVGAVRAVSNKRAKRSSVSEASLCLLRPTALTFDQAPRAFHQEHSWSTVLFHKK